MLRISAGDEWKTAFCTKQCLFEYTVMLFSVTSIHTSFQDMMDTMFNYIEGCIWYLDNILIGGGNAEHEHKAIVEKIQQQCVEYELAVELLNVKAQVRDLRYNSGNLYPTAS